MWLRLYTDLLNDPKVQRLAPEHFKGWVNLLCLAKEHDGLLPAIEDIAFRLRIEDAQAGELIETLKARGLLDDYGDGQVAPHNWAGRQYETDAAAPSPSHSEKGTVGNHVRWHASRGILADDCIYCRPGVADPSQGIAATSQRFTSDSPGESPRSGGESPGESRRAEADSETDSETDSEAAAEQSRRSAMPACLPALPTATAAASNPDSHLSAFARAEIEDFVRETKPHSTNPGGLARRLWRSGEEDGAIRAWKQTRAGPIWPAWVFDPKEPGTIEEKKRFHLQLCEEQRRIEAEFKQEAAKSAA